MSLNGLFFSLNVASAILKTRVASQVPGVNIPQVQHSKGLTGKAEEKSQLP